MSSDYSYRHHIIPLHEWRRRINPKVKRNDKEFNTFDNVVWLTLEQHAHAHRLLYELNGSEFDKIAYQVISGVVGAEEAQKRAVIFANTGRKRPKEFCDSQSIRRKGEKRTIESRALMSAAKMGKKRSPEARKALRDSWTLDRRLAHSVQQTGKKRRKP